jgi:hypothetical protein
MISNGNGFNELEFQRFLLSVKDATQTSEGVHCKTICEFIRAARISVDTYTQIFVTERLGQGIRNQPDNLQFAAGHCGNST